MENATQNSSLNTKQLMEHFGGDIGLLAEMYELFQGYYVDHFQSIETALGSGDSDTIRETAHQFKGAIGNFFAPSAFEAARAVEFAGRDGRLDDAQLCFEKLKHEIELMNVELRSLCNES